MKRESEDRKGNRERWDRDDTKRHLCSFALLTAPASALNIALTIVAEDLTVLSLALRIDLCDICQATTK